MTLGNQPSLLAEGRQAILIEMEHKLKIKEISQEPILVRKTNKYVSRLPRLSMDKEGRLVLFTDNMSKYLESGNTI
jgi:hypothetical protein